MFYVYVSCGWNYLSLDFIEFTEATRITGGLSKHRQKPYNAYYPNN